MTMEYAEEVGYVIEEVKQRHFPITKSDINEGGIQDLINCINFVKNHVSSLKDKREHRQKGKAVNRIKKLLTEAANTQKNEYDTTAVFWPKTKDGLFLTETCTDDEVEIQTDNVVEYSYGEDETEMDDIEDDILNDDVRGDDFEEERNDHD